MVLFIALYITIFFKCILSSEGFYQLNSSCNTISSKRCNGLNNCLDFALNVIKTSERYNLFQSLWFDAMNGTNPSDDITMSNSKNFKELMRKATDLFNTHFLIWEIAPGLNVKVFKKDEEKFGMSVLKDIYPPKNDGRTFGVGKRRIMMALLPIMYKLGVITTLMVVLTILTLKGLTIGVILLMLSFGGIVSKLKSSHYHTESYHAPKKDIHIHVHSILAGKPDHYYQSNSPWQRDGDISKEDLSTVGYDHSTSTPASWSYLPPFMYFR